MEISDGVLRAFLDGEVSPGERQMVEEYLAAGTDGQRRLAELAARREQAARLVGALEEPLDASPDAEAALEQMLRGSRATAARPRRWFLRPAWGALAASVALIALLVASGSTRAIAQKLLGFLRMRAVTVVTVDRVALMRGMGESNGKLFGELISETITETKKPGPDVIAAGAEEASDLAGFRVRLPEARTDRPVLKVKDGAAFQARLDRKRVRQFLDLAGRYDIELPESLDGAAVAVEIPKSVHASYGNCPEVRIASSGATDSSDCQVLIQVPAPTVVTLPDFDIGQLAEVGLQVAGMSVQEARAIREKIDWTSTLVLPIPSGDVTHEEISVDGERGVLLQFLRRSGSGRQQPGYTILWIKQGVAYALAGANSGLAGVPVANSLR